MKTSGFATGVRKTTWEGPSRSIPWRTTPITYRENPPGTEILEDFSYLDELPRIRGKRWGSQGIGRLREGPLVRLTEHE